MECMPDPSSTFGDLIVGLREVRLARADTEQLAHLLFDYAACSYSGTLQPSRKPLAADADSTDSLPSYVEARPR